MLSPARLVPPAARGGLPTEHAQHLVLQTQGLEGPARSPLPKRPRYKSCRPRPAASEPLGMCARYRNKV